MWDLCGQIWLSEVDMVGHSLTFLYNSDFKGQHINLQATAGIYGPLQTSVGIWVIAGLQESVAAVFRASTHCVGSRGNRSWQSGHHSSQFCSKLSCPQFRSCEHTGRHTNCPQDISGWFQWVIHWSPFIFPTLLEAHTTFHGSSAFSFLVWHYSKSHHIRKGKKRKSARVECHATEGRHMAFACLSGCAPKTHINTNSALSPFTFTRWQGIEKRRHTRGSEWALLHFSAHPAQSFAVGRTTDLDYGHSSWRNKHYCGFKLQHHSPDMTTYRFFHDCKNMYFRACGQCSLLHNLKLQKKISFWVQHGQFLHWRPSSVQTQPQTYFPLTNHQPIMALTPPLDGGLLWAMWGRFELWVFSPPNKCIVLQVAGVGKESVITTEMIRISPARTSPGPCNQFLTQPVSPVGPKNILRLAVWLWGIRICVAEWFHRILVLGWSFLSTSMELLRTAQDCQHFLPHHRSNENNILHKRACKAGWSGRVGVCGISVSV